MEKGCFKNLIITWAIQEKPYPFVWGTCLKAKILGLSYGADCPVV